MKKKIIFRVVLIVLCVLCTLSVLQIRNVLVNHRQNERDDSFDEDSPHDLVLPPPPEFEPIPIIPRTPGLSYDDEIEGLLPPAFEDMKNLYDSMSMQHGLLYNYEPYYMHEGWNYTEKYTPEPKLNKNQLKDATTSDIIF